MLSLRCDWVGTALSPLDGPVKVVAGNHRLIDLQAGAAGVDLIDMALLLVGEARDLISGAEPAIHGPYEGQMSI